MEADLPVIPVLLPGVSEIPEGLKFLRQLTQVRFNENLDERTPYDELEWGITGDREARL